MEYRVARTNSISSSGIAESDGTKVGTGELEMLTIVLYPTGAPTNSSH
jgi:hypothetical protein